MTASFVSTAPKAVSAAACRSWREAVRNDRSPEGRRMLDACVRQARAAGRSLDAVLEDGSTPLSLAVEGGHVEAVRTLLARGAKAHAADGRGRLPLALNRGRTHRCAVTVALIKAGARPEALSDGEAATLLWDLAEHCPGCAERTLAAGLRVPANGGRMQGAPLFRVLARSLVVLMSEPEPARTLRLRQWRELATRAVAAGAQPAERDAAGVPTAQWLAQAAKARKAAKGNAGAWEAWQAWRRSSTAG